MIVFNQTGRGTYWRALNFARVLARQGHAVTLLATSPGSRLRLVERPLEGLRLVEAPDLLGGALRSGWDPWNSLRRIGWLDGQAFDIVHGFECRPVVIYPALAAARREAALVLDWCDWFGRGGSVEERPNPLVRAALRPVETYFEEHFRTQAAGTTVINSTLKEKALRLGVPPASIRLIRNGSDLSVAPIAQAEARLRLGLAAETPLVGFVGGAYTQDARLMAAAFNRLHASLPAARLLLVGYFNRPIEQWIDRPEAVLRSGPLRSSAEVFAHLAACDLFWLPLCDSGANRGRWPYKLNDYLAAGRPVVASAVGDLAEIVPQYGFGVTAGPDPGEFAGLSRALLDDPARRQALGQAARQTAEQVFNWDRLTGDLLDLYRQALAAGNSHASMSHASMPHSKME